MSEKKPLAELVQEELIEPLLPVLREALREVLDPRSGRKPRDIGLAKTLLEVAADLAVKERMSAAQMRRLIAEAAEHARNELGANAEDVFETMRAESRQRANGSGTNDPPGTSRTPEHLEPSG